MVFPRKPSPESFNIDWRKSGGNLSDWKEVALMRLWPEPGSPRFPENLETRLNLSPVKGELTIFRFKREDEGLYKCFVGRRNSTLRLKLYSR